jgi:hypothetical protein
MDVYFRYRWAVTELRRLVVGFPPRRLLFDPTSGHVGFVADRVALGPISGRLTKWTQSTPPQEIRIIGIDKKQVDKLGDPGYGSRYGDWLRTERPRGPSSSPGRAQHFSSFHVIQTAFGALPASNTMGTGAISPGREADNSPH